MNRIINILCIIVGLCLAYLFAMLFLDFSNTIAEGNTNEMFTLLLGFSFGLFGQFGLFIHAIFQKSIQKSLVLKIFIGLTILPISLIIIKVLLGHLLHFKNNNILVLFTLGMALLVYGYRWYILLFKQQEKEDKGKTGSHLAC